MINTEVPVGGPERKKPFYRHRIIREGHFNHVNVIVVEKHVLLGAYMSMLEPAWFSRYADCDTGWKTV
jgi:hypothetical protein